MRSKGKNLVLLLIAVFLIFLVLTPLGVVNASSKTIVVPDDFLTIEDAVNRANEGDTIFVRAGTYEGPVNQTLTINKTLTLLGENPQTTKISLHPLFYEEPHFTVTNWVYQPSLEVNSNNFLMSGFTIQSTGGDVQISGSKNRIINNNVLLEKSVVTIRGSEAHVEGNNGTLLNLAVVGSNHFIGKNNLTLKGGWPGVSCKGSNNGFVANAVSGAGSVYVEGSTNLIWGNTITIANGLDVDGTGNIIAKNVADTLILLGETNVIYGNTISNGLSIISSNGLFYANDISLTNTIVWKPRANNTFYQNNFRGTIEVALWGNQENGTDYWDNGTVGNYWSAYRGQDLNNDGVGDTPFIVDANNIDRYPLMEQTTISNATLELPDWANELLSKAFSPAYPSPSPAVPEVSALAVLTLLLVTLFVSILLKSKAFSCNKQWWVGS